MKRRPVHESDRQVKRRLPVFLKDARTKREQEEVDGEPGLGLMLGCD